MAFYQFLCASTVMTILLSRGCHSQQPVSLSVCGRAVKNTSIVGGRDAAPGSWPWLVSLNSYGYHFCSGSLINKQWVLTAAHCLSGKDLHTITVSLGRLNQSGQKINEVSRGLERIVCHPSYKFFANENNICLLKLSAPVIFTDYIQPVCLASAGSTFHTGVSSYVTGFGKTQAGSSSGAYILQEVKVPIVGNKECKCTYPLITDNVICAGFGKAGKASCQRDGGAPLVTNNGLTWIQSGIENVGNGCSWPMFLGEFARVSQYQAWITNIIDSSETGFVTYSSSGVDSNSTFKCTRDVSVFDSDFGSVRNGSVFGSVRNGSDFGSVFGSVRNGSDFDRDFGSGENDGDVDSGGNVVHLSHLTYLCLLVISLSVLV
ncbi:trypsin II-P29-like [Anarhichas minor]|uniref:trypsin II-P29-like n=1 Tax=Anarhichas minor TaxID=65739 RepID=UPI003F736833